MSSNLSRTITAPPPLYLIAICLESHDAVGDSFQIRFNGQYWARKLLPPECDCPYRDECDNPAVWLGNGDELMDFANVKPYAAAYRGPIDAVVRGVAERNEV